MTGPGETKKTKTLHDDYIYVEEAQRSFAHVLFLHAAIRIRYFFESWFLLKPLLYPGFSKYQSPHRPKEIPHVDYFTGLGIKICWVISAFARNHRMLLGFLCLIRFMHLLNWIHGKLMDRVVAQMEASGVDFERVRERQIPEYDWKNGNPEEFYNLFVKNPHPVVLRGFMTDTELTRDFTFEKILERYGDEDVLLTRKELDGVPGKLREVDDPKVYLHNSEILFRKYPEVTRALNTKQLEPYLKMKNGYSQIFVGRCGTGSPCHNASVWNMFYMVDGSKKWYMIDPADAYLAYPMQHWGRAAGFLLGLYPDEYDEKALKAFKYCPYYTIELQPGDVMFNPPWWYHGIRNTSETSVGIATRWHPDGIAGSQYRTMEEDYDIHPMATYVFMLGEASWPFLQGVLKEPSPRYDEHATLREKKNRFTHIQRELANGDRTFMGWRPLF